MASVIAEALPGAHTHLSALDDQAAFRVVTIYYSFVTLTSVGYGDITPFRPLARSLAMVGAVTGQVCPATLLASVAAMSTMARHRRPTSDRVP